MNTVRKLLKIDCIEEKGIIGQDIVVAILDTGMAEHPDLKEKIILFKDFVGNREKCYDDNGHGTHVAGIIAGESKDRFYGRMNINGIAKGSQLVVLKVLNAKGIGIEDKVIDGIKWIIDNYEKYNIKRLLKELVGIYKPKAQNKNLDFRVSIASDIPEYLYGDGINLKKVLTIILDNSIKYTNNGYIEFNINTIIKGDIVRLIISVEDSGIGMKAGDINKIFTKKQEREDNHNLNNNLYNAKRLITLMNGTIVPSSSYGSGTTIKIILDQKYDTIDTDINKYNNIYDKKKVLLIDDSPSSEKLFNKILSGTNIELTSVKLGKEGLEKIRNKEKYDLILLDEELEPQNGHIIMRKLLEIRNFNTKVILLTKDNKYDYDDSYLQEGFTDYIIKSSDKEEILNKMNKYLS